MFEICLKLISQQMCAKHMKCGYQNERFSALKRYESLARTYFMRVILKYLPNCLICMSNTTPCN